MPDADDFDVEYFRKLLKGKSGQEKRAAPGEKKVPPAAKKPGRAAKPTGGAARGKPSTVPKKGRSRRDG